MAHFTTLMMIILASLLCLHAKAQTTGGKVTGKVTGTNQTALAAATVSMLRAADSVAVKTAVTGSEGAFVFTEIPAGKYLLLLSAVGYERQYSSAFEVMPGATIQAGSFQLQQQSKELGAVTVTSTRLPVEHKIDRMVVNVAASVTNAGATAMDVLENSPGVQVDRDGNISLKGKQGVIVMMDGRPTYLGAADLANLLRSMPASQLDQIEIMTNPPARFDASGNSGVINIKTKKNKQFGYNGSVTASYGQGRYYKTNQSANFNYRDNKINLFSSVSLDHSKTFGNMNITRRFRDETTKELRSNFIQESHMRQRPAFYSGRVGLDYFASRKTTLGLVVNGFISPRSRLNGNVTDITDATDVFLGETRALSNNKSQWKNLSTNINFRQLLDTGGHELTADLDFVVYDSWNDLNMINAYFDESDNPTTKADTLLGHLPQHIKIWSARADYILPLKKDASLEAGVKSSIVRTDNNAVYDSLTYGVIVPDLGRSNHFVYEENINAAYVNLKGTITKKWSGQLGLRLENTHATGHQLTTGEKFDRNYTQLFPTAYLQYTLNKGNSFVLNYGRRIRRPDYESLNPFIYFLDRYTYQQGNPNLSPQFSHTIELTHSYKRFITTTINYFRTTDIIQEVLQQNEATNETYMTRANIAKQRQVGISVNMNHNLTKWWRMNLYMNLYNNKFEGIVNNTPIDVSATSFNMNGSQQFTFAGTWNAEISGFFRSAGIEGVLGMRQMGMLSAGIGKQILKKNGTVRLNVRDILYTQRFSGYSRYSNIDTEIHQVRDSRVLFITFNYRFSKGKMNGQQRRRSSDSEEVNRVNVGN